MPKTDHQPAAMSLTREPPKGLFGALRYMGPGLILSASIVGSGELIATTTLGAKAGFSLLWVILLGCVVKVAVQVEYGRAAIIHGVPTLQVWNLQAAPGRRHWSIYVAAVYMLANMAGQAGVMGGAAQVGRYAFPGLPLWGWLGLLALLVGGLIFTGRYEPVEGAATLMNTVFILAVFYCVIAIQSTDLAFSGRDLASGLTFQLPAGHRELAIAAFGITGVAAGEVTMYPYWCLEKGYARWTGPREDTPEWRRRARGWMRVMTVDAVVSMAVYTVATCGFFILGATVLRAQPELRDGSAFILQLSSMFTEVLGTPARVVFMLCAFTVLFSTLFANAAGFSRVWVDFFGLRGWIDWNDERQRGRSVAWIAWLFPVVCGVLYLFVRRPLVLVVFMGLCNAAFLVVVAWQAVRLRYRLTPASLRPSRVYDAALWISLLAIGAMTALAIKSMVADLRGG